MLLADVWLVFHREFIGCGARGGGVSGKFPSRDSRASPSSRLSGSHTAELSRHLLRAQEEERKRISRELHDDTGQALMVLRFYVGMLSQPDNEEHTKKVQEALSVLDRTIEGVRRIIGRLSPRPLEELGLLAAVRKEARDVSRQTGMKSEVTLPEQLQNIDHEIEIAIYRSVQEALHNIAKHSQANRFKVEIQDKGPSLCLLIEDDGVGFSHKSNSRAGRFGLVGMKERAAALGGIVRIHSRKGIGTRLTVTLPADNGALATKKKRVPLAKRAAAAKL
jgi:signal transduction histidine kinase